MCQKCIDAVDEIFPEKKGDMEFLDYVLWNETPFPMGSVEQIREALLKAKGKKK